MISAYIDAFLLACPSPEAGREAFIAFIDGVLEWTELPGRADVSLFISSTAAECLIETRSYPLWEPVQEGIAAHGVVHVQAKDVVDLVNRFLTKVTHVESALGLNEFLFEDSCVTLPRTTAAREPQFERATRHLGIAIYLLNRTLGNPESWHVMVSREFEAEASLRINGTIEEADGPGRPSLSFPVQALGEYPLIAREASVYAHITPEDIWSVACEGKSALLLACAIQEAVRRYEPPTGTFGRRQIRLACTFPESVWQMAAVHNGGVARSTLRACAEIAYQAGQKDAHRLRTGSGGNDPYRVRASDGAAAWRKDIDHEHHLHYWDVGQSVELATVVIHADMSIPE